MINGAIGGIERLEIRAPAGQGGGSLQEIPVPEGLDYEHYLGPAPMRPCTEGWITKEASCFCSDYSIGFIAGWGAHPLDIAVWGQDSDQEGPFEVQGTGKIPTSDGLFDTIATWDVNIEFAGGIKARFMSHDIVRPIVSSHRKNRQSDGTTFFDSKGWIRLSRNRVVASNPQWFREKLPESAKHLSYERNHFRAFVNAVRDHAPSMGPLTDAVRSDAISHLSVIAIQSGEEVVWDPQACQIISPEALRCRMGREIRGAWKQSWEPVFSVGNQSAAMKRTLVHVFAVTAAVSALASAADGSLRVFRCAFRRQQPRLAENNFRNQSHATVTPDLKSGRGGWDVRVPLQAPAGPSPHDGAQTPRSEIHPSSFLKSRFPNRMMLLQLRSSGSWDGLRESCPTGVSVFLMGSGGGLERRVKDGATL